MRADFGIRFIICLLMTAPVIMLTFMVEGGYWIDDEYFFHGNIYIIFILSSFVYFYGGLPFLKGLFREKKKLVVAIVNTAVFVYSTLVLFGVIESTIVLFWLMVVFIDLMLLVSWIGTK